MAVDRIVMPPLGHAFGEMGDDLVAEEIEVEVASEFLEAGEKVVVLGRYSATSKGTGRSFEAPFAHVFTVRDGVIVDMQQYADTKLVHDAWKD